MALRCFLFSSDEGTSDTIRQVMTGLGVEGESCSEVSTAIAKVAGELFQIVVVDWDQQADATALLSASRERKASERPLILAIVSDDSSIPKALQAGANSILKKPLMVAQVTDTLTTARDLLRSRQETTTSQAAAAAAASASISAPRSSSETQVFVPSVPSSGAQFETDTEVAHFPEQTAAEQTDPLKDLEPMASAVPEQPPAALPPDEPKGLEWYLKARGVARQPGSVLATTQTAPKPKENKPDLLGYDQPPSASAKPAALRHEAHPQSGGHSKEKEPEPKLFSSVTESESESSGNAPSRFRAKGAIAAAVVLAALAVAAAPQAPWHSQVAGLWSRGRHSLQTWLHPQPVTAVTQAPTTHENFARPGDEYKLPVAETIPDATTDPSQISVVPVVDPTAKKPAPDAATPDPAAVTPDAPTTTPTDPVQPNVVPTGASQPTQPATGTVQPTSSTPAVTPGAASSMAPPVETPAATTSTPVVAPAPKRQPAPYVPVTTAKVPSSLKSQIAVMMPDASGNKPIEAALPAIEPVAVPELTERALLADQPAIAYPANAAGKQGTVTLQVLIGRDGTVQDAKFVQGSLAFARAAVDGVKQWKFKPYTMNGRPVSVQTNLTVRFAPGQ